MSPSAADDGNTMRASADSHYIFNLSTKLSRFNAEQDLAPGRYELKITEATIAPVIVEFDSGHSARPCLDQLWTSF